ncbi:TraB/GumN family protein [Myxococcota bacterium]|nr:TraB/GumN family protein [Myxococcota bacterium]
MRFVSARALRLLRAVLGIGLALALGVGCAGPAPRVEGAGDRATPPAYRIEGDAGADLILLGTVHFGPAKGWDLSPALDAGIALADRFVFEIDPRALTDASVGDLLAELAVLEPGRRLSDLIAPETAKRLEERDALLTSLGFPRGAREGREPWYVAVSLVELPVEANGWSMAAALEQQLFAEVQGRPVLGLETVEEQLRMLDGLPYPLQDLMLRDTLERLDEAAESLQELAAAWQRGDEANLAALAREGIDEYPELDAVYDVLLDARNRRWLGQLRLLLDDPAHRGESVLVAVGALHLVGDEGLVELLRQAGYRAEAVPHDWAPGAPQESHP